MKAVNYTEFRKEMKAHMDLVSDNYDALMVTRKEDRNVVVMSEASYNNLLENMHVMGNKANYDWLMESKAQLKAGKVSKRDLVEE